MCQFNDDSRPGGRKKSHEEDSVDKSLIQLELDGFIH